MRTSLQKWQQDLEYFSTATTVLFGTNFLPSGHLQGYEIMVWRAGSYILL